MLESFLANGLCKGAVFGIVGLGFGMIYTTTRVFHIAHAGVYVLTGYLLHLGLAHWNWPLAVSIPVALLGAVVAGAFTDWAVYQPLARRSASGAVVLISSLGVQIVFENAIALAFGNQAVATRTGVDQTVMIGSIVLTYAQVAQLVAGGGLSLGLWLFLKYSRAGQVCRAVADDETLAAVLGVRIARVRLMAFAVGSIFAGIGSVLISLDVGIDPHDGFPAVLAAAVACIVGGLRKFLAPMAGGLALGLAQSVVVWQTSAKWEQAVTFGVLIVFLLVRPQGLFGVRRRAEEA
ncbi:MAG TPA: branched-chain amino acid ABC transporter permease [Tepidisphaeraceae bacterium]|nr:branched-chain amino acid ABC transporter permease [Tepidisphaeraceae bacterium]